jgi:four helix bundle protein
MKSYKELVVYKLSFDLYIKTHKISLELPKFELYELGSQMRRASDSVVSNIVEGYGRRAYKQEFIRFLIFAHASCQEMNCHISKIKILYPTLNDRMKTIDEKYNLLGGQIYNFIRYVYKHWKPGISQLSTDNC